MFAQKNEKEIRKLSLKICDIAFNLSLFTGTLMIFEIILIDVNSLDYEIQVHYILGNKYQVLQLYSHVTLTTNVAIYNVIFS